MAKYSSFLIIWHRNKIHLQLLPKEVFKIIKNKKLSQILKIIINLLIDLKTKLTITIIDLQILKNFKSFSSNKMQ